MKVRPTEDFFNKIRDAISSTRQVLSENKQYRKDLMTKIAHVKGEIRRVENVNSHAQTAQVDPTGFLQSEVVRRQQMLQGLRLDLLAAELFHQMERKKFHILHTTLDQFNQPVDPSANRTK